MPTFPTLPAQGSTSWYPWAGAVHNKALYTAAREIDLAADYGVVANDSSTATATANTTAINQCLTDVIGQGRTVVLPMGVTYINNPITAYDVAADTVVDTRIRGNGGNSNSRIQQNDNTKDVFIIRTSIGNIRGLLLENFEIWFGRRALWLSRATYNFFRNIRIRQSQEWAIYADNASSFDHFEQCWIYENPVGNAVNSVGGGALQFVNCVFGELCGAIYSTGNIRLTGCVGWDMMDHLDADGLAGTGASAFVVSGLGRLQIVGGDYNPVSSLPPNGLPVNAIYTANPATVQLVGARFTIPAGAAFMETGITVSNGAQVQVEGCGIQFLGDGQLIRRTSGVLVKTQWVGNKVQMTTTGTVTVDDALFSGANQNVWDNNDFYRQ